MNLFHEELLNEQYHRRLREMTAVDPLPSLPKQPPQWRIKIAENARLISHLRQVRIQVTFEVAEPCPDIVSG
jgi:hypothetical protein